MSTSAPETPDLSLNANLARSSVLEFLYHFYGRSNPDHPDHALYTGLLAQARSDIGQTVLEEAAHRWTEPTEALTIPVTIHRG